MARTLNKVHEKKRRQPATNPQSRENQLISAAFDLAEKQILEGTASAQVITHFLKLGTAKENLEREKLARENELLKAKAEAIQSQKDTEKLYKEAIKAMQSYAGFTTGDSDEEDI